MAVDDVAVNLTDGDTVTTGGPNTSNYNSRWIRSIVDPRFNNLVHLVFERQGDHSLDRTGIHYILYNLETEEVVRQTVVIDSNVTNDSHRYPDIAFDPGEGKLWVVYVNSGDDGVNPFTDFGGISVLAKTSVDNGATWSSQVTVALGGTPQLRFPRVAFGLDGTGYLLYHRLVSSPAASGWRSHTYQGSSDWGDPTTIFDMTSTAFAPQTPSLAVSHNGRAAAILVNNFAAGGIKPLLYFNDGTGWQNHGTLATFSTTTLPIMVGNEVKYNLRNEEFQCVFDAVVSTGTDPNMHRVTIDNNGLAGAVQDSGIQTVQSATTGHWMSMDITTLGDVYVFSNNSTSGFTLNSWKWTRSTNTWSGATAYDWDSQIADHSAADEPGTPFGGSVVIYLSRMRLFFSGDSTDTGTDEDIWTAEDPNIETVDIDDILVNVGDIVGLHTFETIVGGTERRRLMAYIGNGIYHDAGENEFAGNILATGAFEPQPDFAVFEGEVYVADGENIVKTWDGATATASAITNTWDGNLAGDPAPALVGVESAANRLWGWTPDIPRRLLFSGLRAGTDWNLTQATDDEDDPGFIYLNDLPFGEPLVAIQEFFGDRICFSRNGVVRVTGDTPGVSLETAPRSFVVSKINSQIGAESNLSVVDVGSDVIWLSRKGVHSLAATEKFGAVEESYLSAPIQSLFSGLNAQLFGKAQAVNYRKKNWYVVSVSQSGDEGKLKTLLIYDYAQRTWAIWTFEFEITALHSRVNPGTSEEELLAGTDRGFVVVLDQGTAKNELGSTEHTGTIRTTWLSGGNPRTYKKFTRLILHLRNPDVGTLTGKYWVDNHDPTSFTVNQNPFGEPVIGSFIIGTNTIGSGAVTPVQHTVNLNARGRTLMVELSGNSGAFSVSGLEVEIVPGASHRGDVT